MIVDTQVATKLFESFPDDLRVPSLHPHYVEVDALRDPLLRPTYFIFSSQQHHFYYPFHLSEVPETSWQDIQSAYGYGGPIATTQNPDFLGLAWDAFNTWCHQHRILAEFVRFHPLIKNEAYFQGQVIEDRQTVWVDLSNETFHANYARRAKSNLKKAQSSEARISWPSQDEFLSVFPTFYREAMKNIGAMDFYLFSDRYFESLITTNQVELITAKIGKEVVAGAIFLISGNFAEYHLSASSHRGKEIEANTWILHSAFEKARMHGVQQFHLGGGMNSNPNHPLLFFKSSFSKERARFSIGKRVHQEQAYLEIKKEWITKNKRDSQRILFYRE